MNLSHRGLLVANVAACAVVAGCSVRFAWPRHSVDVSFELTGALAPGASIETDVGVVSLDDLALVVDSMELVPCDDGAPRRPTYDDPLARLGELLVPAAHAHGVPGPTRLATPVIVDADARSRVALGTLTPPPGTYCEVIVGFGPADDDAVGLDDHPEMLGLSVRALARVDDARGVIDDATSRRASARFALATPMDFGDDIDIHCALELALELDAEGWGALIDGGTVELLAATRSRVSARWEALP